MVVFDTFDKHMQQENAIILSTEEQNIEILIQFIIIRVTNREEKKIPNLTNAKYIS